jgi:hypothetical protein
MYTRIDELIWKDAKLKKISNESKLLFIYLLSCQHRNVLGLYNLPKYYVQGDLGYSFETVSKGLEELFNSGFITYDDEAETILVNNFLKYNPLENPNQVKGALKVMPTIPKTQLFYKLVDVIKSSENTHLHELKAGIESYLKSNGFERVSLTVSKQEEVKEEVSEEEQEAEKEFVNTEISTQSKVKEKREDNSKELINAFFESVWKLYPEKRKGKSTISDTNKKELYKIGFDEMKRAIERYSKEVYAERDNGFKTKNFKDGSTFFRSHYKDYLDANYEEQAVKEKENINDGISNKKKLFEEWANG